jgi:hypothetical protein
VPAPRIAPSANRPRPPICASTPCIYRLRHPRSSETAPHSGHISASARSARTRCHVSSSAGV